MAFASPYRFGPTTYEFIVQNPDSVNQGVQQVSLNGETLLDKVVPLLQEGGNHTVLIIMG